MKVRLSLTPKGIQQFEKDLDMWRVPKGKWVKRDNIYEGGLFGMQYRGRMLELRGFTMRRLGDTKRKTLYGNSFFCPDGLVIFAGIRTKEGWREVYSS